MKNTKRRNERIFTLRTQGKTLQYIGDIYGLSRERVRQILDINYNLRRRKIIPKSPAKA